MAGLSHAAELTLTSTARSQIKTLSNPDDATPVTDSYLVEVSVLVPSLRVKVRRTVPHGTFPFMFTALLMCARFHPPTARPPRPAQDSRKDVLMMSKQLAPYVVCPAPALVSDVLAEDCSAGSFRTFSFPIPPSCTAS